MVLQRLDSRRDRWIAGGCAALLGMVLILAAIRSPNVLAISVVAGVLVFVYFLARWHAAHYAYQCPNCGQHFEIGTSTDLISRHMQQTRYLNCPGCGKRDWARAIPKSRLKTSARQTARG